MNVRKRGETRSFEQITRELLTVEGRDNVLKQPSQTNSYLIRGEYANLLSKYYELFPEDHIIIFFTDELKDNPQSMMRSMFRFVGVDDSFIPPNLGTVYQKGGSKRRISGLHYRHIRNMRFLKVLLPLWQKLLTERQRSLFWIALEQWNVVPDSRDSTAITQQYRTQLQGYYEEDARQLATLIGREVPLARGCAFKLKGAPLVSGRFRHPANYSMLPATRLYMST